jgi:UDP-N-acetylglucosamine acyltransferase
MTDIHPSAVVSSDAEMAKTVVIGPNCYVDKDVHIDEGTTLEANVVIAKGVRIGKDNHLFSNCVIGAMPQVLDFDPDKYMGGLQIGDRNIIREHVTIHPSRYPDGITKVGNETFLMVGSHLGHDCNVEDKVVLSNYCQIAGHCKIEKGAWLSGMVGAHQFVTIGKWSFISGLAGLNHDVPPFMIVSGHYPPEVRGVNKRGLQRAGLNEQEQQNIYEAYKRLYREDGALLENARAMGHEIEIDENVKAIIDAIENSSKHRFGRYLETLREIQQ